MEQVFSKYRLSLVSESEASYQIIPNDASIISPNTCAELFKRVFDLGNLSEEAFVMFTLDAKLNVTGAFTISMGSINRSVVHPREVFKRALLQNAHAIILAHNHPSGDVTPSKQDYDVTDRLVQAGEILGVQVIDHVIVGFGTHTFYSFKEKGDLV